MPKVTIQDVAKHAQVSIATVSRVLNNNETVTSELRERVLRATEALGYTPDRAARRLRAQKSDVLGLVVADIQNPHFVSVIQGVQDAAYERGMNIILCDTNESPERLTENVSVLRAESVAGLIIVPTPSGDIDILKALQANEIPFVILDRKVTGIEADSVMTDSFGGAHHAVSHLIKQGYRDIAGMFPDVVTGAERRRGFIQAHRDAGLADPLPNRVLAGSYRTEGSYKIARQILTDDAPDAIFTATNFVTLGVMRAIRELNLRVPDEIALVGFDDLPYADELFIPYTAMAQPTYEIGQTAVRMLLERIVDIKRPPHVVELPAQLITRESCGAKRASGSSKLENQHHTICAGDD